MSIDPKYYTEDIKTINRVDFCVFTNKEIKSYSAVSNDPFGINLAESYENYEPKKGGLVDLRLGTCEIYLNCTTCGLNSIECPGHFGHTELVEPVFHYGFFNHLKSILQCICLQCSKLLIDNSDTIYKKLLNNRGEHRFKEIKNLTKNTNYCHSCGTPVGKIKKEEKENTGSIRLILEREVGTQTVDEKTGDISDNIKKISKVLMPRDCYNILRNLSDKDCYILGLNPKVARPEDLIIQKFPIPPVIIRPSSRIDFIGASTTEDSLTIKIADIINANRRKKIQLEKENITNELSVHSQNFSVLLQYQVAVYYDNTTLKLPRSEFKYGGQFTKSITERIKSKQGRVRSNLMGKRVDFSARSVITSDPCINIDEVGIPKKIAIELTIPEEVTPSNIKKLSALVMNGRDEYPGANFVFRTIYKDGKPDIQKIDLKYRKKSIKLNIGDVVERHAINGDYVLFNRQPTLHKPSMMGHKIHVLDRDDCHSFRMNVSVCKPYNADFDGDEMNIYMAQSVQARNELKRIANVKYQIISAKDSSPIIGCVEDALSGCYLLTKLNNKISGSDASNFLCNTSSDTKYQIDKSKFYTGQEIFSHIIPKGINNTIYKDDKKVFEIIDGELLMGTLNKNTLSTVKNSIIHFIWDKYGPDKTRRFIDDAQRLALSFLNYRGFTFGVGDCITDNNIEVQIKMLIESKILGYKIALTQYENQIDQIDTDIIESKLSSELNAFSSDIGNILIESLTTSNNLFVCVDSKSKGNIMNLQHMMGCIGQKSVAGARIVKKMENRTLPIFHRDDDTPEARGFVKSSFMDGVKSFEFFYDAMAGREGLIDTAIKSVTGETPIIIIDNGMPKYIEIGEWINNLLENSFDKVQHFEERQMELLDISNTYIPTTDYKGNVSWGAISAVTRHDPGTKLYEIRTETGRSVIVTESKSLLIWDNNISEFREKLTPLIKIGDNVPVTCQLSDPPILLLDVNFKDYIKENNDEFNQIKFKLNNNNGILIGIALTKDINYDTELIKNSGNKVNINNFIADWCNLNYNITLSKFLRNFIGTYKNKHIPNVAFIASEEFIKGIINGYFSSYSNISSEFIEISSIDKRLLNSISMLCSRIGILCEIYEFKETSIYYKLKITDRWIKVFSDKIKLICDIKNQLINNIIKTSKYQYNILINKNNNIINNVFLDKIIEIKLVDITKHKKVYDLTIPTTFNFGIANGLQVRDTAKTGYIQRQLIKGLEDLVIKYDNTNRNVKNVIIQYIYGESGIEQSYQTELIIKFISLNNIMIEEKYGFSNKEILALNKAHKIKDLDVFNNAYIQRIIGYRNDLIKIQTISKNNYKILEEKYMLPVNLFRLTQDYSKNMVNLELTPHEIIDAIEELLSCPNTRLITGLKETDVHLIKDDRSLKYLFEMALHDYLCPKKCIFKYGLSRLEFKKLISEIKLNFIRALIPPGEMVGIIAAQSIGEPTSQMSLMSTEKIKCIKISKNSKNISVISDTIGILCDSLIKENPNLTFSTGHPDSVETVLDTLAHEYYIIGVDANEKTQWNKISHISRHPVNGQMMKVTTKSGRIVHTTTSHSHLVRKNQSVEPIIGSDMSIGMRIPVARYIDNIFIQDTININTNNYNLDYLFGWFIGAYLANGIINGCSISILNISELYVNNAKQFALRFGKDAVVQIENDQLIIFNHSFLAKVIADECTTKTLHKKIPNFAFTASNKFKIGLLQTFYDIKSNLIHDEMDINVSSNSKQLIKDIALLLNYFDIFSSIKYNKLNGTDMYNLSIHSQYSLSYKYRIGTQLNAIQLSKIIYYKNNIDEMDQINGLYNIILECKRKLNILDKSDMCNNVNIDKSISRQTLKTFITYLKSNKNAYKISDELLILVQASESNVIWDEIVKIELYDINSSEYVYDFTVPSNQTFMTDYGIIVHNTLNTKHSAGVASKGIINAGVPRIEELLHYSRDIKTPQMTIYFDQKISNDRSKVNKIASYLTHITIKELIDTAEIYYDIESEKLKNDKVTNPFFVNNQKIDISALPFVFRLKLNMEKMYDKETSLLDIKMKFIKYWTKNFSNLKNIRFWSNTIR